MVSDTHIVNLLFESGIAIQEEQERLGPLT